MRSENGEQGCGCGCCCGGGKERSEAEAGEPKGTVEAAAGGEALCPVETTLGLIGGKYKALILWHLMEGALRFSELSRSVPGATPRMLTRQLRELEASGLVARRVFAEVPVRVEYSLTGAGRSIYPILSAMYRWGSAYLESQGKRAGCSMKPPEED